MSTRHLLLYRVRFDQMGVCSPESLTSCSLHYHHQTIAHAYHYDDRSPSIPKPGGIEIILLYGASHYRDTRAMPLCQQKQTNTARNERVFLLDSVAVTILLQTHIITDFLHSPATGVKAASCKTIFGPVVAESRPLPLPLPPLPAGTSNASALSVSFSKRKSSSLLTETCACAC